MTTRLLTVLLLGAFAVGATPPAAAGLFSSYDVVTLKITAPLNELFEKGRTLENKFTVTGSITYGPEGSGKTIEGVTIGLRGHTSVRETECSFPKLKLRLPAGAPLDRSPFAGMSEVKIGTHCGDSTDTAVTAKYGRLPNERAPHREALVYRLLDAMEVPALKARPARITYVFSDARSGDQPVVRNAMLLEDSDDAVKRLGGTRDIGETSFTNAREQFASADVATLYFAQAMIGNFDWCLKMTPDDSFRCNGRHPLWNIIAVAGADSHARPVMYDFDVSGMVAGQHRWFASIFNEAFIESRSHPAVEVLGQLQRTRSLFTRVELDATRERFNAKKAAAYTAVDEALADAEGKKTIREYLDAFFAAIGSDEAFYRPAVVTQATAFAEPSQRGVVCGAQGAVPIGTIASEPRQTNGRMTQVVLLDTMWHWAPPVKCPAVHKAPVWIDSSAISRDYPPASRTH